MPKLKDIMQQAMTGGAVGGMGKMIMDALKKRKKPKPTPTMPTVPTPREGIPQGPMKRTIPQRMPMPQKPPKEQDNLNKKRRWTY